MLNIAIYYHNMISAHTHWYRIKLHVVSCITFFMFIYLTVTVDITDPIAGWVRDGANKSQDMSFSSQPATLHTYWQDYYDNESGIDKYDTTVTVNDNKVKSIKVG